MKVTVNGCLAGLLSANALLMLAIKLWQLPVLRQEWADWAAPSSGMPMLTIHLSFDLAMLAASLWLARHYWQAQPITQPVFFSLAVLTAMTGLLGCLVALMAIAQRVIGAPE